MVFEDAVGLVDSVQRVSVRDERSGVEQPFFYQFQDFRAVASVYPSCLECQVLPVHVGKRQDLRSVIHGDYGDDGVRPGAFPGHSECFRSSGYFYYAVCPAMVTVCGHEIPAVFRGCHKYFRIMLPDKTPSFFGLFADYDAPWLLEHGAKQSAYACRSGADDKDGIFRRYFRDADRPEPCSKDVPGEKRLLVADGIRYPVQSLVCIRNSHIFGLPSVDAASQCPSAVRVGTVVDETVPAEKTMSAECLYVDGDPVSRFYCGDLVSCLFDNPDHFVPDRYAWHRSGYATMSDMQVAGADARQSDLDYGVCGVLQFRYRFLCQFELPFFYVCVS